jgi:hypothetical protein
MFLIIGAILLVLMGQKQALNGRVKVPETRQAKIKRMTIKENLSV